MNENALSCFAKFMNPSGIDISAHAPIIMSTVNDKPMKGDDQQSGQILREYFPDIPSSNIIIGGANTLIAGDVRMGAGNAVMEGCHIRADGMPIIIGKGNNFQNGVTIHISKSRGVGATFGNHNSLTHGVIWHGATAGNLCFVAFGSTINDGAQLGDKCFVDTNSNVAPYTCLQPDMAYAGRIDENSSPTGESREIVFKSSPEAPPRPLGEITEKYSTGQLRSAQTRRLFTAARLGTLEIGGIHPAYAYIEHIALQTGAYYLQRSVGLLMHSTQDNIPLAKGALDLCDAIDHIFRGKIFSPERMNEIEDSWSKRSEIINEIAEKIVAIGSQEYIDIPTYYSGLNHPIRMEGNRIKRAADKLLEFDQDMKRCERLAKNPPLKTVVNSTAEEVFCKTEIAI